MESRGTPETIHPSTYSISVEQFQQPLSEEPSKYSFGSQVTRENFTSMYTDSFAESRGDYGVQLAYFEWLHRNTNFDYRQTLQNFLEANTWDNSSYAEQQVFINAYNRVNRHGALEDSEILANGRQIAELLVDGVFNSKVPERVFTQEHLRGLSKEQFMQEIQKYLEEKRQRKEL